LVKNKNGKYKPEKRRDLIKTYMQEHAWFFGRLVRSAKDLQAILASTYEGL
tara:strand:- start:205 stop:357 length:153 start_codon:yes stop_codon:yes gene_type:complete